MIRLNLKPLSVNKCWRGKKTPTAEFKQYRLDVAQSLPDDFSVPKDEHLFVYIKWGLSNRGNDIDNGCKPFLDLLQRKYDFNDNKVYALLMEKDIVRKGEEYIEFEVLPLHKVSLDVALMIGRGVDK